MQGELHRGLSPGSNNISLSHTYSYFPPLSPTTDNAVRSLDLRHKAQSFLSMKGWEKVINQRVEMNREVISRRQRPSPLASPHALAFENKVRVQQMAEEIHPHGLNSSTNEGESPLMPQQSICFQPPNHD